MKWRGRRPSYEPPPGAIVFITRDPRLPFKHAEDAPTEYKPPYCDAGQAYVGDCEHCRKLREDRARERAAELTRDERLRYLVGPIQDFQPYAWELRDLP